MQCLHQSPEPDEHPAAQDRIVNMIAGTFVAMLAYPGRQVRVLRFCAVQMNRNHLRKIEEILHMNCSRHDGKFGKGFSHDSGYNRQ